MDVAKRALLQRGFARQFEAEEPMIFLGYITVGHAGDIITNGPMPSDFSRALARLVPQLFVMIEIKIK